MMKRIIPVMILLAAAVLTGVIVYTTASGNVSITSAVIEEYTGTEGTAERDVVTVAVAFSAPADAGQLTWLLSTDLLGEADTILYADQTPNDGTGKHSFPVLTDRVKRAFGTDDIEGKTLYLRIGCTGSSEAALTEIVFHSPYAVLIGDANGDGVITNRDASRILQYLADWPVTVDEAAADANADGGITNRDASRILQYLAGWPVTLG